MSRSALLCFCVLLLALSAALPQSVATEPGTELFAFDQGAYFPLDIRTDADGQYLYVVKAFGNQGLLVFAGLGSTSHAPGTLLHSFLVPGPVTSALDSAGNMYVAQVTNGPSPLPSVITVLASLTSTSAAPGSVIFTIPNPVPSVYPLNYGVTVDRADYIYLTSYISNEIFVFSPLSSANPGQLIMNITGPNGPLRVVADAGLLYVANYNDNSVEVIAGMTSVSSAPGTVVAYFAGNSSGEIPFNFPNGVDVDSAGNIYVADANNFRVVVLSGVDSASPGTAIGYYNDSTSLNYLGGVTVDAAGTILVADTNNNRIVVLAPITSTDPGAQLYDFQPALEDFYVPFALALDSLGNIYVDDVENSRIVVLAGINSVNPLPGTQIGVIYDNATATNNNQVNIGVKGISVDSHNRLWLADTGGNQIVVLSPINSVSPPPFSLLYAFNGSQPDAAPRFIAFDTAGNSYTSEISTGLIVVRASIDSVSPPPGTITALFTDITTPFQPLSLKGIWLDSNNNVYAVDNVANRIVVLAPIDSGLPPGTELFSFSATTDGGFNQPLFVTLDPQGRIYVADNENSRCVVLAGIHSVNPPPGTVLTNLLDLPEGFVENEGVAVDQAGYIYLSDADLSRVVVLAPLGPLIVGTALGDPQITGFLGQSYQVHGIDGAVYSIISAASLQVNARFTFLQSGVCPIYGPSTAGRARNCWSHPGSYFGAIGFRTAAGSRLLIQAGNHSHGFQSIVLDGIELTGTGALSESAAFVTSIQARQLSVDLIDRHHLTIQHGIFTFSVDNSDAFLNVASVSISSWQQLVNTMQPHGLLGQTWHRLQGAQKGTDVPEVEGRVDDYADGDGDLFGFNNAHSRFEPDKV